MIADSFGKRRTIDIADTDLPLPDQPKRATVAFFGTSKEIPFTASNTCPPSSRNLTPRLLTSRSLSIFSPGCLCIGLGLELGFLIRGCKNDLISYRILQIRHSSASGNPVPRIAKTYDGLGVKACLHAFAGTTALSFNFVSMLIMGTTSTMSPRLIFVAGPGPNFRSTLRTAKLGPRTESGVTASGLPAKHRTRGLKMRA